VRPARAPLSGQALPPRPVRAGHNGPPVLCLFDIDGTLPLKATAAHAAAVREALREVYGVHDLPTTRVEAALAELNGNPSASRTLKEDVM
jgi:hypothetical protein